MKRNGNRSFLSANSDHQFVHGELKRAFKSVDSYPPLEEQFRKLWFAVLQQCVKDLRGTWVNAYSRNLAYNQATAWIGSKDCIHVCDLAGVNYPAFRDICKKIIDSREFEYNQRFRDLNKCSKEVKKKRSPNILTQMITMPRPEQHNLGIQ